MIIKASLAALLLALAVAGVWSRIDCCAPAAQAEDSEVKTVTFHVTGMTCGGCATGLKLTLSKMDGVKQVEASYEERRAVVRYDPSTTNPERIIAAIEKLGYKAELQAKKDP